MNIKQLILLSVFILTSLTVFIACDKIEEPFFKPVYTDRNILSELVTDTQSLDQTTYDAFVSLNKTSNLVFPMLILSDDNNAGKQIADAFSVENGKAMLNRSMEASEYGISKEDWEDKLNKELEKKGEFNLEIEGQVNFIDSTFTSSYKLTSLNGAGSNLNLSVYLLEDSVNINGLIISNVLKRALENINLVVDIKRGEDVSGNFSLDLSGLTTAQIFHSKVLMILEETITKEILQVTKQQIGAVNFSKEQKVLIEDFTGQHCTYCPKAHEEIDRLETTFGKKVVAMAIHYGWQADADSEYPIDYKTEVGTTIGDHFADQSEPLPFGFVNRIKHGSKWKMDYAEWDAEVNRITALTAKAGIAIEATVENNALNADVYVKAFEQLDTLIKIQGFIIESHMHSKQKFYESPWEIDDYEQNHVLRATINGNWGEDLVSAPFTKNQIVKKTFSYNLNSDWVPENLALIIIVYNSVTEEIIQVEEKEL